MNVKRLINIYRDTFLSKLSFSYLKGANCATDTHNFLAIRTQSAFIANLSVGYLRWWMLFITASLKRRSNSGVDRKASRYVRNCGHVPEVKTRPQNTDCITRPYYPRLHSTFEEHLLGRAGKGEEDRKFRKFHRENHFQSADRYRNEYESRADRYVSWHSGNYLYASTVDRCRGKRESKTRIGKIS